MSIASTDRLIFALDVASLAEARLWIDRLGDAVTHYKIGLELLGSGEYFTVLAELKSRDKRVFADLKLHDIPATVAGAVSSLAQHGADLLTVHAYADAIAAAAPHAGATKLLAVTVLTSMSDAALAASGVTLGMAETVERRAVGAFNAGASGVVCSGLEAGRLRDVLGHDALIVCPGIRSEPGGDDQQRTVTVEQAFELGASHIVVGRPIRHANDPRAAAEAIQTRIANLNA